MKKPTHLQIKKDESCNTKKMAELSTYFLAPLNHVLSPT